MSEHVCLHCGGAVEEIYRSGKNRQRRQRRDLRFCSRQCWREWHKRPEVVEARFWSRVNKSGPIHPVCGQCWEWTRYKRRGYGSIRTPESNATINRMPVGAHRYSWQLANGIIPAGLDVLHKCDNPCCVNPWHLFLGTDTDNAKDKNSKGRGNYQKGEESHAAKLTEKQVREIRRRFNYRPRSRDPVNGAFALAKEFGVAYSTIIAAARGKNWRHIK